MGKEIERKFLVKDDTYKSLAIGMRYRQGYLNNNKERVVLAEVELESEDQPYVKPDWIGDEITGDPKYFNSNLIKNPCKYW